MYSEEQDSFLESAGKTASQFGTGAAGIWGTASLLKEKAGIGILYSIAGMEPLVSNNKFGAVFSSVNAQQLRATHLLGGTNAIHTHQGNSAFLRTPSTLSGTYASANGAGGISPGAILQSQSVSALIPLALTTIGAIQAIGAEGAGGFADFMVQDAFANYFGVKSSTITGTITNQAKAENAFGLNSGSLAGKTSVQLGKSILGMPMLGRMLPIIGAYSAAALGMEAGRSAFKFGAESSGGYINEGLAGTLGGILGAAGGAFVGSQLSRGIGSAAIGTVGVMAIKGAVEDTFDKIGSGLKAKSKARGLNYAGDISAAFTQNAVTMRQRAVQAMHKSHMNARSAMGREATITHMNRDMFSQYKRI